MGTLFSQLFSDTAPNIPRIFAPPSCWQDTFVECPESAVRHLKKVFRIRTQEQAAVFDGNGRIGIVEMAHISQHQIHMNLVNVATVAPPEHRYAIAFGLLKNQHTEQVIQQAVELGVHWLIPLISSRTVSRPSEADKKLARWNKMIEGAVCQSGRAWAPVCEVPKTIEECCHIMGNEANGHWMMAELTDDSAPPLHPAKLGKQPLTGVIIGPEGDFSPAEKTRLKQAGAHPVSLGSFTLRSETAAAAAAAIMMSGSWA